MALREFLRFAVPLAAVFAAVQAVAGGALRVWAMLLVALLIASTGGVEAAGAFWFPLLDAGEVVAVEVPA